MKNLRKKINCIMPKMPAVLKVLKIIVDAHRCVKYMEGHKRPSKKRPKHTRQMRVIEIISQTTEDAKCIGKSKKEKS